MNVTVIEPAKCIECKKETLGLKLVWAKYEGSTEFLIHVVCIRPFQEKLNKKEAKGGIPNK